MRSSLIFLAPLNWPTRFSAILIFDKISLNSPLHPRSLFCFETSNLNFKIKNVDKKLRKRLKIAFPKNIIWIRWEKRTRVWRTRSRPGSWESLPTCQCGFATNRASQPRCRYEVEVRHVQAREPTAGDRWWIHQTLVVRWFPPLGRPKNLQMSKTKM